MAVWDDETWHILATLYADLDFVIEVGPITDDEHLVVRWKARGTYRGGFPGASPEAAGQEVAFTGTDTAAPVS